MKFLRIHLVRIVALAMIAVLYFLTRLPQLNSEEILTMSQRFSFTSFSLPTPANQSLKTTRPVHRELQHIEGWINILGAATALNDLDGNGLCDDICWVDPRTDQVLIAPVPGQQDQTRYKPFTLDPSPLPYDEKTTAPMGCVPGDLNEDGLMDIIVYYWGRTPIAFLRTEAVGSMLSAESYVAVEIYPTVERWYTNALTRADVDGDGHADLIIGNYFADGAAILDANDDQPQYMQDSMSRAFNGGSNRILLWTEASSRSELTVSFTEVKNIFSNDVAHAWTLAIGAADLDGDLLPEIYFANDFGPDRLLHNRSTPGNVQLVRLDGVKTIGMPNSKVLGRDSFKGMGIDFADLNGDGWLDIFVSNIADEFALQESHFVFESTGEIHLMKDGIAPYVDRGEPRGMSRSGWGWDTRFGDFDNDGVVEAMQATGFLRGDNDRWPELHELAMSNDALVHHPWAWPNFRTGDKMSSDDPNPFYVQSESGRYFDLSSELGIDKHMITRAIATADVDGDGDLDFAIANQWEESYFYLNVSQTDHLSLVLYLLLSCDDVTKEGGVIIQSGPPTAGICGIAAIGAQATVRLTNGNKLVAQVDGGNGHSGCRSHQLHFGVGKIDKELLLDVDLHWRDRTGYVQHKTIHIPPGTHTILLHSSQEKQ